MTRQVIIPGSKSEDCGKSLRTVRKISWTKVFGKGKRQFAQIPCLSAS